MKKLPLSQYLESHGTQTVLAEALGIQQSAVSQMVRSGRNIEITLYADGRIVANEIRPVPVRPKRSVA